MEDRVAITMDMDFPKSKSSNEKLGFVLDTEKNEAFIEGKRYLDEAKAKMEQAEGKLKMVCINGDNNRMELEFFGSNLAQRFLETCKRLNINPDSFRVVNQ